MNGGAQRFVRQAGDWLTPPPRRQASNLPAGTANEGWGF